MNILHIKVAYGQRIFFENLVDPPVPKVLQHLCVISLLFYIARYHRYIMNFIPQPHNLKIIHVYMRYRRWVYRFGAVVEMQKVVRPIKHRRAQRAEWAAC